MTRPRSTAPKGPTKVDRERLARLAAANQHASYMRGWVDGAKVSAMRPELIERPAGEPLRVAYERGYGSGRDARSIASQNATNIYGHQPQILRLCEEPTS